jgi:hypothetical protein
MEAAHGNSSSVLILNAFSALNRNPLSRKALYNTGLPEAATSDPHADGLVRHHNLGPLPVHGGDEPVGIGLERRE